MANLFEDPGLWILENGAAYVDGVYTFPVVGVFVFPFPQFLTASLTAEENQLTATVAWNVTLEATSSLYLLIMVDNDVFGFIAINEDPESSGPFVGTYDLDISVPPSTVIALVASTQTDGEYTPYGYGVLGEITLTPPAAPVVETCQELGRVTRAYVSAHTRTRVHDSRLYPREKRCLVANFNAAIPVSRSIASVVWDMDPVYAVSMSDAAISGREARVMVTACWPGCAALRCEITLDNGEVYNQLFRVAVQGGPYFGDSNTAGGPARLTASA